jgi:hypothetical protein
MKMFNVKSILALGAMLALSSTVQAEVLYSSAASGASTVDYSNAPVGGVIEVGDEINLKDDAASYAVKSFSFDYVAEIPVGQSRTAVVKLYQVDGTDQYLGVSNLRAPRTLIYTSTPIALSNGANGFTATLNGFPPAGLNVTKHLVWSVSFQGGFTQVPGNRASLVSSAAGVKPTVGRSFDDYWYNSASGWILKTATGSSSNYAATLSN